MEKPESESKTIRETLPHLNESMFIPSLQRDYCWDQQQIEKLWDSLLRGLPLGSLLLWEADSGNDRDEPAYSFISQYVDERAYPEDDGPMRYSQRYRPDEIEQSNYSLVLDGQQRLTSFYISLLGSYTTRVHGGWKSNPDAWNERELYIDLLSGEHTSEHDRDLVYDFDFRKTGGLSESEESYWLRVGQLIDDKDPISEDSFLSEDEVIEKILPVVKGEVDRDEHSDVEANLRRLWWAVNQQDAILFERTFTDDRTARELFIRRNKAGKELSGVDILLALLTGYWGVEEEGKPTDAKKQIEAFVEELSSDTALSNRGFSFGKNYLLRTLLLFCGERPAFRKNGRYDGKKLRKAEQTFESDRFRQAIQDSYELAADLGFHNGALSSKSLVTPITHHLHQNQGGIGPTFESEVHYWLSTVVLNSVFSNIGTERVLKTAKDHIDDSDGNSFPAGKILDDLRGSGAVVELNDEVLSELLDEVGYSSGSRRNTLLTHLYEDRRAGHRDLEVDHIFPRGKLADSEFLLEEGVEEDQLEWFEQHRDHIANLQLLTPKENQSKSDRNVTEWLDRIEQDKVESIESREEYYSQHFVPESEDLHEFQNFQEFVRERTNLIEERLEHTLPLR
jgi:hypothetical protein